MDIGITCENILYCTNVLETLLYFELTVGKNENTFSEMFKGKVFKGNDFYKCK